MKKSPKLTAVMRKLSPARKLKPVEREASHVIAGCTAPAAMAVGWVGTVTSVTLQSSMLSPRQAATPTFASYVGRPRRATMIANRAKHRWPTRETARSLGAKLRGVGSSPDRSGYGAKFESYAVQLHPGEDVRRERGRSVLLEERS